MSHFYGTVQGNRGEASRGGSKDSGIISHIASWEGAIKVQAWYDEKIKKDMVRVKKTKWRGVGENKVLYEGEMGEVMNNEQKK